MVIRSDLKFLEASAAKDDSSARELAKFGLRKQTSINLMGLFNNSLDNDVVNLDHQSVSHVPMVSHDRQASLVQLDQRMDRLVDPVPPVEPLSSPDHIPLTLQFGSLDIPVSSVNHRPMTASFFGKEHRMHILRSIAQNDLYSILDLRQAKCADIDIGRILNLKEVPLTDVIHDFAHAALRLVI